MKIIFRLLFILAVAKIQAQPPTHAKWNMVWNDEFNGVDADLDTKWNSQNGGYASSVINCSRWRKNAVVGGGVLKLNYIKEPTSGTGWSYQWTAASISTKQKFKYGYFECRYKIAPAAGTNNSFWLINTTANADTTIKKFEIDINEGNYSPSSASTKKQIGTNTHNWSDDWVNASGTKIHYNAHTSHNPSPWYSIATQYHTMGLEWNEKELIWYLDGAVIRRSANLKGWGQPTNCFDSAPVYLSAATGWGTYFEGPLTDAANGTYMEVDYVRVYEKQPSPVSQSSCANDTIVLTTYAGIPDVTTYRWEVSTIDPNTNTANAWIALNTGITSAGNTQGYGATYAGVSSNTLTITAIPTALTGARYRCLLTTTSSGNLTAYPTPYTRYSDTATVVEVKAATSVTASVNAPNFVGSTVRLSAMPSGGAGNFTYSWSGPSGFSSTSASPFIPSVSAANNGVYSVRVDDANGCTKSATVTVNATTSSNPLLTVSSSTPNTLTAYSFLNLIANPTGGSGVYTNYNWTGPNNFTSTEQNPTIPSALVNASGDYTVFVTDNANFTSSLTIPVTVNKRPQTVNFTNIANQTYTGSESSAIALTATATTGGAVTFTSSNTCLASIVGNSFVANRKRPDYSIQLPTAISTTKVRIYSTQTAHFHIREFRVYAPNAAGYPADPLSETADIAVAGLVNYARQAGTTVAVSGSYDPANSLYNASNARDGIVGSTSWVSQTGSGAKWIELTFSSEVSVGCIQFVNGWLSGATWNALMSSYAVEYWNGSAWVSVYDCNVTITAAQAGDANNLAATTTQKLCINPTTKSITNTTSLPLELLDFQVKEQNKVAFLNWKTANEVNLSHFEIERSADGEKWIKINDIKAAHTEGYVSKDENAFLQGNTAFYRLKMVDFDGSFSYSPIRQVVATLQKQALKVYPSPTADVLNVHFEGDLEKNKEGGVLGLYDLLGRLVFTQNWTKEAISIDVSALPKGIYMVVVQKNGQIFKEKFIKQ